MGFPSDYFYMNIVFVVISIGATPLKHLLQIKSEMSSPKHPKDVPQAGFTSKTDLLNKQCGVAIAGTCDTMHDINKKIAGPLHQRPPAIPHSTREGVYAPRARVKRDYVNYRSERLQEYFTRLLRFLAE